MSEYATQLRELMESANRSLELPADWDNSSDQSGQAYSLTDDDRLCQRIPAKNWGLMWLEESHHPQSSCPHRICTRDFSIAGVSFLAPLEIAQGEQVRVVLPTMWMQLSVVRAQQIGNNCFEIGAKVINRHDPSCEAFEGAGRSAQVEQGVATA